MKSAIWQQFGAAIDMLENAITACPDRVWGERIDHKQFWYIAFHTLFFLDLYLSDSDKTFAPPPPFTLDEMDERGLLPDRIYTRQELLDYLRHGRDKCRRTIGDLTDDRANSRCGIEWLDISMLGLLFYNMRHVQHHTGQLNLLISREMGSAPRWVRKTERKLETQT